MSNLSDLLPAGASGKKAEFTASGAISSGDTVIVNTDGTVSVVASVTPSFSAVKTFESGSVNYIAATYDPINEVVVVAYADAGNSSYGTVVAGVISGDTISFGTPVVFYSSSTEYIDIAADTINGDCAIVYRAQTWGRMSLASINGTSISIGTGDFYQATALYSKVTFCEGALRWCVAWQASANSSYLWAGMLYRSGSSLAETGKVQVVTQVPTYLDIVYDSTQNVVVIVYKNNNDSNRGYAVVGNFISSPTGVSFTSSANTKFSGTSAIDAPRLAFDSDTNQVLAVALTGSDYPTVYVMQAGPTGIAYGSPVILNNSTFSQHPDITYDATTKQAIVACTNGSGGFIRVVPATVGDLTVTEGTFTASTSYASTAGQTIAVVSEPSTGLSPVFYRSRYTSDRGDCLPYDGINTNALPTKKFVGVAEADISNSATGEIMLTGGISETVSIPVLENNSTVYLQKDGSLSSTVSPISAGMAFNAATGATPDTSQWSYESKSLSVGSQDTIPNGVAFNSDGTKLYIAGNSNDTIYQYALTTAYDVSTGSYESKSFSVASQLTGPCGLAFNTDGTKMYVQDFNNRTIFQYTLSTAFDVSTASYNSVNLDASARGSNSYGMVFNPTGTSLFISFASNDTIFQYTLSTAFDLSTASYASKSFDASQQVGNAAGIGFTNSGKKMYILDNNDDDIHQYTLSTAYDVSTASYSSSVFDLTSQDSDCFGMVFKPDGTKLYVVGRTNDRVYQYSTTGLVATKILLSG